MQKLIFPGFKTSAGEASMAGLCTVSISSVLPPKKAMTKNYFAKYVHKSLVYKNRSDMLTHVSKIFIVAGTALINPTNFLLLDTLTPQCHCFFHSGGFNALQIKQVSST